MREQLRLAWSDQQATHQTGPGKRDWVLVGALVATALVEVAARPDVSGTGPSLFAAIGVLAPLPWRRSRPLAMASIAFGIAAAFSAARLATGRSDLPELHTTFFLLLFPYSLFRWGTDREAMAGAPIIVASSVLGLVSNRTPPNDFLAGLAIVLASMAIGAAVRYRARVREHEVEQAKASERERIARDLHDSVAHHVSAIAIRAQAGLALAPTNHEAAVDALRVIATEASRSLAEMRSIVRFLRESDSADLAPTPRIADLERHFADRSAGAPLVAIDISGDVDGLSPTVSAAVFRLAQESITNARRHARNATRIQVEVAADEASVRLRICDDGDPSTSATGGYGLTGMSERTALLGGSFRAGPNPERGWTVAAELPRRGTNA
ncbi:sensor histidine kinase [Vulgatibacter incomptus]|uniref:histidine kinase n=1 Tax=Vulgatibacter incomptus TaxID=1391653 RepID=A0A0K1PHV8_9BACT|nr:sensor histidine kinase [Vulgatibacter incomptus]AKU92694.1 Putative two-component system sensor kinase [Vulgatibacter incomptus]